jgi:hypothetical protein
MQMEYKIKYDEKSNVCTIQITGHHRRPHDSKELLRIAGAFAEEHKCSRFVFDMREANIMGGTLGAYEVPIEPEKFGVSKRFRIAAVYQAVTEDDKFMENVGVNRGAVAFRVFDDIDTACKWIVEK